MKILKIIFVLLVFIIGYIIGNIFSWSGFREGGAGILGPAKLEVIIMAENNRPIPNLEVDVAEKPSPPQRGGVAITDKNGVAAFEIKPGSYFIYFNSGNFPQNLKEPEPQPIHATENSVNKATITLKSK